MALTDKQVEEVLRLLGLGTADQRQRFLGYLEGLRFSEGQDSYDISWWDGLPWHNQADDGSSSACPRSECL